MNPAFQNGGFDPSASPDDFIDELLSAIQWPAVEFADETLLPYYPTGPGGFRDESASDPRQQQIAQNNDAFHGSYQALYNGFAAAALLAGGGGSDSSGSRSFLHPEGDSQNLGAEDAWLKEVRGQRQRAQAQQRPSTSATAAGAPSQSKPRVRARRGQATDPHSIAERLRREKISERMKALQQLVPIANKTDKGSMVDEVVDYVKFLQLQVKLLSMSRLGGGAAAAAAASIASEGDGGNDTTSLSADNSLTMSEKEVAKLMEEDMGTAMQYLQGKGLCLIPISAAAAPHVSPSWSR